MEFGVQFFPNVDVADCSAAQYFAHALAIAGEAERLGFTPRPDRRALLPALRRLQSQSADLSVRPVAAHPDHAAGHRRGAARVQFHPDLTGDLERMMAKPHAAHGFGAALTPHAGKHTEKPRGTAAQPPKDHFEALDHPGHLIRRLHQICVSVFLREAREYKLTRVQYASLVAIDYALGIDQSRLGKLVALDRQTVSDVVQRLCEKGLLERKQKDRRTSALFLTGAAKALIQVIRARIGVVDDIILEPLTLKERQVFMALFVKLVKVNNKLSRAPYRSDVAEAPRRQKPAAGPRSRIPAA